MAVAVAGAAGFIGTHLCEALLRQGETVIGLDNLCSGQADNISFLQGFPGFRWMRVDITQPFDIPEPLSVIYDLACPASPVDFEPLSLEILTACSLGVRNLLDLARRKGALFFQASTSECYGDPKVHPQPESYYGHVNPIGERSPYDEGKRYAEAFITAWHRRYGLPVRIARIFNTYGPRMRLQDGRVLPNFITQALHDEPLTIHGTGRQTRSFCYIDDMVDGMLRLTKVDYTKPVNIGNPDEVSIRCIAEEVIEITGSKSQIISVPARPDDPAVRCPDITLARRLLDWEPRVGRLDGLRRTIADFRQRLATAQLAG